MLRYTGHPLIDVGVATITAYSQKDDPQQLTENDLDQFAQFLESIYFGNDWKGWMFCIFLNSVYTQYKIGAEKKSKFRDTYTFGYKQSQTIDEVCTFCGKKAIAKGYRHNIPLISGVGDINFFAEGKSGLPACGLCFLCIQAFLLGAVKCSGRALLVHSDNSQITLQFAKRLLDENRRSLSLNLKHPKTVFFSRLAEIEDERLSVDEDALVSTMTIYHLTNDATNPDINMYHLPYQVLSFFRQARKAPHGKIWSEITQSAWELETEKKKNKKNVEETSLFEEPTKPGSVSRRNYLYEDIFNLSENLPKNAPRFVRTYFLRRAHRTAFPEDPRHNYSVKKELNLVSWKLTEIFLMEVMNVDKHRIDTIKKVADRIASLIASSNDKRLFQAIWMSRKYTELRLALIRADLQTTKSGSEPLLSFDEFITIFEFGEESQRPDWNLARDLMLIRIVEQLHTSGWFNKNQDALPDEVDTLPAEED